MNLLTSVLSRLLRVHYPYDDPFSDQQARALLRFAWVAAVLGLLYIPIGFFSGYDGPHFAGYVVGTVSSVTVMIGIIIWINQGHLLTASITFVGVLFISAVLTLMRYAENPLGINLFSMSMPIIATGVLLNRRAMLVMIAMIGLTILGINIGNTLGIFAVLHFASATASEELWFNVIYIFIDAVLLTVFAGGQVALVRRNAALVRGIQNSASLTQTLTDMGSVDDLLQQAVEMIRDQFGYYFAQAYVNEEATGLLVQRAATGLSYSPEDRGRRRIARSDESILNEALAERAVVRVSAADPASRRTELLPSTQFELLIPMIRSGKLLGVLDIQSINADFDTNEVEIMQAIASQLSAALQISALFESLNNITDQRDQAHAQLREARRELEQLGREASGYGWTRYLRSHPDGALGFDWANGKLSPNMEMTTALSSALSAAMPEITIQSGVQIMTVPIVLRGQVLGAMEFQAPVNQAWNNRSLEVARVISQRLALALDNVRLYEQAQTIADRERIANQIASRLQAKTDMDALVALAAESFQQALGATRTSIRMGTPEMPGTPDRAPREE